jgi:hypothetical protein
MVSKEQLREEQIARKYWQNLCAKEKAAPEVDKGRRPDRARVWWLSRVEVINLDRRFEECADIHLPISEQILTNPVLGPILLSKLTRLLHELYPANGKDYPQAGDLVYIEHELGGGSLSKYFYDGSNVILPEEDLEFGIITVPRVFEVITEFPIRYWKGRLYGFYFVSFNLRRCFPDLTLSDIKFQDEIPYFRFNVDDDTYTIYPNTTGLLFESTILPEDFLEQLQNAIHFTTVDSFLFRGGSRPDPYPYIRNIDPERTLFLEM